jgi:rod shape-determining protein MreC
LKGETGFRKFWIWVFLVAFALLFLSSSFGRKRTWNPAEQLLVEVTAPLQRAVMKTIRFTEDIWLNYFFLVNLRQENRSLREQMDALRIENSRNRERLAAHGRLQALLEFRETIEAPIVAGQVIGLDPTGWFKSVIIDKGSQSGISVDMPVVNASGVVGRIVSVSPNYAKVLLVIDQNSAVDCLVQRSRARGMVKGLSTEDCSFDYVVASSDALPGDLLITSGLGGVFPKGLPVGKIVRVVDIPGDLFKEIQVAPVVDFSKLEEVLVILRESRSSSAQIREE